MLLLTTLPQAILLSSTGNLIPSCFSNSLVAVVIFTMFVTSLTTGFITRRITTLVNAVECMIDGMRIFSPLILLYVFSNQLYYSFCYTFIP
ncbi:AbgT family transporter [uncultured Prevotella sp.]|uniref:AbgT family transporter n=1 Tax=uncultured Prevotella sp. TaxID=159272 RepID=UPI00339036E4